MRAITILSPFLLIIGGLIYVQAGVFAQFAQYSLLNSRPIPLTEVARVSAPLPPLTAPRPAMRPAFPGPEPASAVAPARNPAMAALSAAILARGGTGPVPSAIPTDIPASLVDGTDTEMLALAKAVLAGMSSAGASTPPGGGEVDSPSLAALLVRAIRNGQSDAYVNVRLNAAARAGDIAVPAAFVRPGGTVDTFALLAELTRVSAALEGPGAASPASPESFYVVQPGDSLGSIARRFYGDAGRFGTIFEANRGLLSSPDSIRVGQRLRIPAPAQS